jgi:hypothetical protein
VERALSDAERLLASQGATSGMGGSIQLFHGGLRARLNAQVIGYPPSAGVTDLFKLLRSSHPAFTASGPHQQEVDKILRSLANVVDALNPVRNHGSVAHANSSLPPQPEAMLVSIPCARRVNDGQSRATRDILAGRRARIALPDHRAFFSHSR